MLFRLSEKRQGGSISSGADSLFQQTDDQLVPQYALLGDVRPFGAKKPQAHLSRSGLGPIVKVTGAQQMTGLRDGEMPTPVDDTRQVELQQALSQRHEGQQAGVEEEQEQQSPLHSEHVRHGAVLQRGSTDWQALAGDGVAGCRAGSFVSPRWLAALPFSGSSP